MCAICHQSKCNCRCPNAPDPVGIYTCAECGEGILEGDEYVEDNGKKYHLDCLDDMGIKKALTLLGIDVQTAEVEGW